jgi:ankyrin repeat protein
MPIHYAVNANDIEMVEFLICLGANVNGADFKGEIAPLDLAFKTGNIKMQTLLQLKGAARKKKIDNGGNGKDVTIHISEEFKKQMQAYIDKRNEEEDKLKKIHEEEVAKDQKQSRRRKENRRS